MHSAGASWRMEMMMRKSLLSTLVVLALCGAGAAMAQGGPGGDRQGRGEHSMRGDGHDRRGPPGRRDDVRDRGRDDRGQYRAQDGRDRYRGQDDRGQYRGNGVRDYRAMDRPGPRGNAYGHDRRYARGVGPGYAYYPGVRLPQPYRTRQYVVEDWRGHRLSAPPRGYHWVQIGADYALVAVATGIILQMMLAN